jgi:hypothetical protein
MTIFGWDASDYDWDRGPMDLGAARRDGIDFFTHKSTESTNIKHAHFGGAVARARDAGIPFIGAYHVVRSPANAAAEVAYCLNYVNSVAPWWRSFPGWFWQVDLEKWPYDAVPASEGEAFADIIESQTGRVAVIYASKGQYGDSLAGTSHELWNANYGNNPTGPYRSLYPGDGSVRWGAYSGRVPKILQYGSQCRIGTQNTCDANAFRGTVGDFAAMIGDGVDETERVAANSDRQINTILRDEDTATVFTNTTGGTGLQPNDLKKHRLEENRKIMDAVAEVKSMVVDQAAKIEALQTGGIDLGALAAKIAPLVSMPSLQEIEDAAFRGAQRAEDS